LETIVILETDLKAVVGSYTGRKWSIADYQMSGYIITGFERTTTRQIE